MIPLTKLLILPLCFSSLHCRVYWKETNPIFMEPCPQNNLRFYTLHLWSRWKLHTTKHVSKVSRLSLVTRLTRLGADNNNFTFFLVSVVILYTSFCHFIWFYHIFGIESGLKYLSLLSIREDPCFHQKYVISNSELSVFVKVKGRQPLIYYAISKLWYFLLMRDWGRVCICKSDISFQFFYHRWQIPSLHAGTYTKWRSGDNTSGDPCWAKGQQKCGTY